MTNLECYFYAFDGGTLECWFEYEPADKELGYNGNAYLVKAMVGNADIFDLLDPKIIEEIEVACCNSMEGD